MLYRRTLILATSLVLAASTACHGGEPMLIAHRGLLRHAPENTLPAFAACVELGLGFELDVYSSRDDQLVVIHNDSLKPTTNGPARPVREFSVAELKKFDAGSWFHPQFAGVTIPTLEEVLAMVQRTKRGPTILALDVKQITAAGERQLVALTAKYGLLADVFALGQDDACSQRLRSYHAGFRIGQNATRHDLPRRLEPGGLDVFLLTFVPTEAEMKSLHAKGKTVIFNCAGSRAPCHDPKMWDRIKAAAFDGLLLDAPLECRLHWRGVQ